VATLSELQGLFADAGLLPKVQAACVIAAQAIYVEATNTANHAARLNWAKATFANPAAEASRMLPAVLAANSTLTLAQLQGVSDASIQAAVNSAVNVFAFSAGG